jgi:hypothetical protein
MNDFSNSIPQTYPAWRHCITVDCGIPLTLAFIEARLAVYSDQNNIENHRFRKLYGFTHRDNVLRWLQQARQELSPP